MSNKEPKESKTKQIIEDPSQPDLKAIAEFEKSQRKKNIKKDIESTVDFDKWWAERSLSINQPAYMKEILRADAKGRGLDKKETMERWDWAAKMFGLLIK